MFKIREFSKFTRVSVKMLRHYDELGLLPPAYIDPANNYRFYSADQLPRLNRIIGLKDLGFSLREIAEILEGGIQDREIRDLFRWRKAEIERSIEEDRRRLLEVEVRLRLMDSGGRGLEHSVLLRAIPAQWIAAIRASIPANGSLAPLFDEAELHAAHHNARAAASPLAIYHDEECKEDESDVEVAVPLEGAIPAEGRVHVRKLSAEPTMACVVFTGSYEKTPEVLHTMLSWIQSHGYRVGGPLREVYHRFDARELEFLKLPESFLTEQKEQFVTELQIPVRPENVARERS